jgi:hypothetical protein
MIDLALIYSNFFTKNVNILRGPKKQTVERFLQRSTAKYSANLRSRCYFFSALFFSF